MCVSKLCIARKQRHTFGAFRLIIIIIKGSISRILALPALMLLLLLLFLTLSCFVRLSFCSLIKSLLSPTYTHTHIQSSRKTWDDCFPVILLLSNLDMLWFGFCFSFSSLNLRLLSHAWIRVSCVVEGAEERIFALGPPILLCHLLLRGKLFTIPPTSYSQLDYQ